ncbi:hypothetical protein RQP46_002208 [Phenoliferia psychrophenolica]
MSAASLRDTLSTATDLLLSPESTQVDYEVALSALERVVASLALDRADPPPTPLAPTQLDAFLTLQDGFEYNVTATLLEWLGRAVAELRRGQSADDQERTRTNLARVLGLVQGLLLLHRRSQRLFARRATLEYMLTILQHSRSSSLLGSPSFPPTTPSPVLLPPSPSPSSSSSSHSRTSSPSRSSSPLLSSPNSLALTALDTLLCALVDRPRNMRAFEAVGGLGAIVKVLKDKSVAQVVRIKAIEILYFYLLPERPPSTRRSTSSSSSSASSCYSDISSSDPFLSATPLTRSPILPTTTAEEGRGRYPESVAQRVCNNSDSTTRKRGTSSIHPRRRRDASRSYTSHVFEWGQDWERRE